MDNNNKNSYFQRGLIEYEKGDYFMAHELWEELWSDNSLKDRIFIQGLIQLAVSLLHLQNKNITGAKNLLKKCRLKFDNYSGIHRGISLQELNKSLDLLSRAYENLPDSLLFDWDLVPHLKGRI